MTNLEQTIMREIADLPKARLTDVLAFIRFLKISMMDESELEQQYDAAIQDARATAKKYNITQDVIDAEIRAVRDGK
jgi:hypothetical protein